MAVALSLFGCARVGALDEMTTASTKPAAKVADHVDPSDWRAVKAALARIPSDRASGSELAWQNPDTGSDGRITALAAMAKGGGPVCRAFATTINDPRGVRRYRGQACRTAGGDWQLTEVTVDDGAS